MVCIRYRARQPRASPVWQVLHDHAAKLPSLHPEAAAAITAFLDCGDLHAGFTRFHRPAQPTTSSRQTCLRATPRQTRWNQLKNSLLDSEWAEVCFFAS